MRLLHEIVGGACSLALILAALGFVGNLDYSDALVTEAMQKEMRVERVKRAHYAELLCDCAKVHRGKWLRLQVVHQPDRDLCQAACFYDGGRTTKGTL